MGPGRGQGGRGGRGGRGRGQFSAPDPTADMVVNDMIPYVPQIFFIHLTELLYTETSTI